MKKIFIFSFIGVLMYGCSNPNQNAQTPSDKTQPNTIEITNDLENAMAIIPSWVGEKTVVAAKEPAAHSGEYASLTNDSTVYSYAFQESFKNLDSERLPKQVVVKFWMYTTVANPNLSVILDINENGKNVDWKAYPLDKEIKEAGKWAEYSTSFYFDKPINPEQSIRIYAWNQSKKPIYFDDYKITFGY